mgnify:CR=1 FL=1
MGLRPSSKSNPTTVSRFLDTGYDNVKKVADNIEDINSISNSIDIINQEAITQVEVIGQGYVDQAEAAKVASEQAASDSQGYSVTAINAKNESIVQAGIATDKANEALQSANESAAQAGIATTQANSAISSANAAATSESNALSSANLAEGWATNGEDILVDGTEYSAKHYSIKASVSAAQASSDAQTISDQLDSTYLKTESDLRYFQVSNNLSEVDPIQGRSNLELGTAATKDVGESAGNVMEVGAFGLGFGKFYSSFDSETVIEGRNRIYYTALASDRPSFADNYQAGFHFGQAVQGSTNAYDTQVTFGATGSSGWRQKENGVWADWKMFYDTGNILGTVSQSGGIPTGAIIESGSNVNGSYTRYADGTLLINIRATRTLSITVGHGYMYRSSGFNIDLPTNIIPSKTTSNGVFYDSGGNSGWILGGISNTETQLISVIAVGAESTPSSARILDITIVSRWF